MATKLPYLLLSLNGIIGLGYFESQPRGFVKVAPLEVRGNIFQASLALAIPLGELPGELLDDVKLQAPVYTRQCSPLPDEELLFSRD